MSEYGDFFVGKGALHAVFVVAEPVIAIVVALMLSLVVTSVNVVLGRGRAWEMFRVELTEVVLSMLSVLHPIWYYP